MTINEFQKYMVARSADLYPQCKDWTPADWVVGFIGEVGEAANIQKKIRRQDQPATPDQKTTLMLEFGDALAYLALWASSLDIDLNEAGIAANNKVAMRFGRSDYIIEE